MTGGCHRLVHPNHGTRKYGSHMAVKVSSSQSEMENKDDMITWHTDGSFKTLKVIRLHKRRSLTPRQNRQRPVRAQVAHFEAFLHGGRSYAGGQETLETAYLALRLYSLC